MGCAASSEFQAANREYPHNSQHRIGSTASTTMKTPNVVEGGEEGSKKPLRGMETVNPPPLPPVVPMLSAGNNKQNPAVAAPEEAALVGSNGNTPRGPYHQEGESNVDECRMESPKVKKDDPEMKTRGVTLSNLSYPPPPQARKGADDGRVDSARSGSKPHSPVNAAPPRSGQEVHDIGDHDTNKLLYVDNVEDNNNDSDDDGEFEMPEEQEPEEQGAAAPPMVAGLGGGDSSDDDGGGICEGDDEGGPVEQFAGGSAGVQFGEGGGVAARGGEAGNGAAAASSSRGVGQSSHKIGMVYSPGSIPLGLRKQRSQHSSALTTPQHNVLPLPTSGALQSPADDDFLQNLEDELNQKPSPPKHDPTRTKSGRSPASVTSSVPAGTTSGGKVGTEFPTSSSTTPLSPPLAQLAVVATSTPQVQQDGEGASSSSNNPAYSLYQFDPPSNQPTIFPSGISTSGGGSRQHNSGRRKQKSRSPSISSTTSSNSSSSSSSADSSVDGSPSDDDDKPTTKKKSKKAPKKVTGGARLALARIRAKQKDSESKKANKSKSRP